MDRHGSVLCLGVEAFVHFAHSCALARSILIRLGDQDIDFSPTFNIFLVTRDPNADFSADVQRYVHAILLLAEGSRLVADAVPVACSAYHAGIQSTNRAHTVCSRVTLVNFTVTPGSLQSQCLNKVLKAERPDVEQRRSELLKFQSEYNTRLLQLERALLEVCVIEARSLARLALTARFAHSCGCSHA